MRVFHSAALSAWFVQLSRGGTASAGTAAYHAAPAIDASGAAIVIIAVAACLALFGVAHASGGVLWLLKGEKGVIEIVSALAYPVGLYYAVKLACATHGLPRAHWAMWAIFCVLFFGEETSWFQAWLGYATPEKVKAANLQAEFNLHNLKLFTLQGDLISASGLGLSWKALLDAQRLFYLGFTTYFLIIPLARAVGAIDRLAAHLGVPRFTPRVLVMVWLPMAFSVALTYTYRAAWLQKDLIGETREMLFALTIAASIAAAYVLATRARRG
jgi:hypothetical protein